jgi:hypothetical protein
MSWANSPDGRTRNAYRYIARKPLGRTRSWGMILNVVDVVSLTTHLPSPLPIIMACSVV